MNNDFYSRDYDPRRDFHAIETCTKCGRTFRTYGSGDTICQNCTPSKPWVPNGSNQSDYGEW